MLCKICVMDLGDIEIFLGILMDIVEFKDCNYDILVVGGVFVISCLVLFGIIKVLLEINSFLFVVFF